MPGQGVRTVVPSKLSTRTDGTQDDGDLVFYPAYCYKASPTWFTWVKVTAYDIHNHLQSRCDSRGVLVVTNTANHWPQSQPSLLFYRNHPIQFVQLVGVVVTFEDYFEKFWLFTVDDSSGATIEVNCRKPEKTEPVEDEKQGSHKTKDAEADARCEAMKKLDIGVVVQVKGQIGTFREIRQLRLERLTLVQGSNEEMRLIEARTDFYNNVLSQPWVVSATEQKRLHEQALGENEEVNSRKLKQQKVLKARLERDRRHAERIAKQYKREEEKRQAEAEAARSAGRLLGCHDNDPLRTY